MRLRISSLFAALLVPALSLACSYAQGVTARAPARIDPPTLPTILYGAAYYNEYEPTDHLDRDIELMKQAGLNVVRMGESTWSLWEPEDGKFEYAWMDRVVDAMGKAGIKVIMGTPTYSIPTWLYREHPEVLARPIGGGETSYGMRQTQDQSNAAFRFYAQRVIRNLVDHYRNNPTVIGWQIDNETGSNGAANLDVFTGFVEHLKQKFGTTDNLNKAWLLNYWGQDVNGWENMPTRDRAQSTGYKLEWSRWEQMGVTDYLWWQADLVRQYRGPGQFVTTDFSGGLHRDVNEYQVARALDIVAVNIYHGTQGDFDGEPQSFMGDVYRSLHGSNYLVTETNAQAIGWSSQWQFPPYDGQARLDVYSELSSGANMVEYWHWNTLNSGQETYWRGVLGQDGEPNRFYREVSRTGNELRRIGPQLANLKINNDVAILYSVDSANALDFMPFTDPRSQGGSGSGDYTALVQQLHRALYKLNVGSDFIVPGQAKLSDYKVVIVPALYIADDDLLRKLSNYVKGGGHVLITCKSAFADENSMVRQGRSPGPMREAAGFSYQEFSTLTQPIPLKDDSFSAGGENKVFYWAEFLVPEHAKVLARYDHPFFGQWAAITDNQFGAGTLTYEGTWLSDELQKKVVLGVLEKAHLTSPAQTLPASIRLKAGTSASGHPLRYFLNYSGNDTSFVFPYTRSRDLLTDATLNQGEKITLKPWDLLIALEQ